MADRSVRQTVLAGINRVVGAPLRVRDRVQPADAIVILGAKLRADGRPTGALDERIRVGAALYRQGLAPRVCVTGGGPPGRVEADVMAARARQLGVPDSALRIERESVNTAENARFSARILTREGCRRVWLVTQPFHGRRSVFLFRKYGLEPLCWRIESSLESRAPALGLRWIAREYVALAHCLAYEVAVRTGAAHLVGRGTPKRS